MANATTYDASELCSHGKVLAEYIWLGSTGSDLRSTTRLLDKKPSCVEELPIVDVDGSASGQATSDSCEIFLKPRKIFSDPFRKGDHILVLCDTFLPPLLGDFEPTDQLQPHPSNNRAPCEAVSRKAAGSEPMFAVEQEYLVLDPATGQAIGWGGQGLAPHEQHLRGLCGPGWPGLSGAPANCRSFAEQHLAYCLHAGVKIAGMAAPHAYALLTYEVGPCLGVAMGDELWMSRYILLRLAQRHNVGVSWDPHHAPGEGGSLACRVKFSTAETRQPGIGMFAMQQQIANLEALHMQHMLAYGAGRARQLPGGFSCGVSNNTCTIMIPSKALIGRCGYYVDRRPGANMDPYLVTMLLVSSALGVPLPVLAAPGGGNAGGARDASQIINNKKQPPRGFLVPQQRGSRCCSPSASATSGSPPGSRCTQELLLDELDRLDGFTPSPRDGGYCGGYGYGGFSCYDEGSDECSDGTSPERDGHLSASVRQEEGRDDDGCQDMY